jgi:hypothetical protein
MGHYEDMEGGKEEEEGATLTVLSLLSLCQRSVGSFLTTCFHHDWHIDHVYTTCEHSDVEGPVVFFTQCMTTARPYQPKEKRPCKCTFEKERVNWAVQGEEIEGGRVGWTTPSKMSATASAKVRS